MSRRTFYEVFENSQQCLVAILLEAEQRARESLRGLSLGELAWAERIRMGLWALLCLADSDPALARVCLVETQHADRLVRRERERIIRGLIGTIDAGRAEGKRVSAAGTLTAEALIGAVSSVIATRLLGEGRGNSRGGHRRDGAGVRGLLGELVAMIVLPYEGPAAARRQIKRALPDAPVLAATREAMRGGRDPLALLPMRLTYRTARVLQAVAMLSAGGAGASNRLIAEHAGISDAGQASKLLWRLQEHDLLENTAIGSHERGEANRWRLTDTGRRLVQSISSHADQPRHESTA